MHSAHRPDKALLPYISKSYIVCGMGTWISHLRVAENLLGTLSEFDPAAFACGNLAPDSGLPNADWSAFDPPKEVTHYLKKGEGEGDIRDLDFYHTYRAELSGSKNREKYSFLWGYFFHLLCDNLWSKRIGAASRLQFAALFSEQREQGKDAFWILKEDWYGLDFRYLRDHPKSLFWHVFMPNPNPSSYVSFISDAVLHDQLDYKRSFYSEPDEDMVLDRAYPYLNDKTVTRFVDDCTSALITIYAALQAGVDLRNSATALTVLDKDQITPYSPPMGDEPV